MRTRISRIGSLLLGLLIGSTLHAQSYKATPLQTLVPGSTRQALTGALGINDSGIVAGTILLPNGDRHAAFWLQNGAVQDIGTLGGNYAIAHAINKVGQVVGKSTTIGGSSEKPFLWTQADGMQSLGTLGPGMQHEALAVNDNSDVTGFSCLDAENLACHAFLWTRTAGLRDLGTLGGNFSIATGINAHGHVIGWSERADHSRHSFIWTVAQGMQEIEPGSSDETFATAINDSDQVVGTFYSKQDGQDHGFLWSQAHGRQDLGTLGTGFSEAFSINNSGDIVGFARTSDNLGYSVIWPRGGAIQSLSPLVMPNNPRLLAGGAQGINTAGQIAANGSTPYLLTPRTKTVLTSAPNPSQVGQNVLLSATVNSISGPPPNGENVTFKSGSTVLGNAPLMNGVASFSTSALKAGSRKLTATYPGDLNYRTSKSAVVIQVVN